MFLEREKRLKRANELSDAAIPSACSAQVPSSHLDFYTSNNATMRARSSILLTRARRQC